MTAADDPPPKRTRISIEADPSFHHRLQKIAAERDLTVQQYVLAAIDERLRHDTGDKPATGELTAASDSVLAKLWVNAQDEAHDRLEPRRPRRRALNVQYVANLAREAKVTNAVPTGSIGDLARHGIEAPIDLASLLDVVFRQGFGYAIGGSPWRKHSPHEAGVFRQGASMTKSTGRTPADALARALIDALDAEAGRTGAGTGSSGT